MCLRLWLGWFTRESYVRAAPNGFPGMAAGREITGKGHGGDCKDWLVDIVWSQLIYGVSYIKGRGWGEELRMGRQGVAREIW